ncbi:MAG: hypothetical protein FD183_1598 [Chitinophagaceae bacterium]|nr:MAG: hypothetical protein FD183_1598 [Chitinophagaceae bacterium]
MRLKNICLLVLSLWCIAVKTNAQTPRSITEKLKSTNILVQQYLLTYKQALNNALDKNDFASALLNLNHIILFEPNNGQALYLRARGFESIGLYERAIFDYDNAQRVGYTDPQLYYFLAKIEIKAGLGEESFRSYNEFFRSQPSQFHKKELRFESGIAAKMAKEYKACVEDMSFVIDEGKDEADAHFNRGICFSELNLLKEAQRDFKEAAKIKPSLKNHWYYITYDRIYKNNCKLTEQQFLTTINKEFNKQDYFDAFIDAQLGLKCHPESKALMAKQLEAMLTQFDPYYDEIIVFYQDFVKKHGIDPVMQQKMDQLLAAKKQISVSDHPYDKNYPNDIEMPVRYRNVNEYLQLAEDKLSQKGDLNLVIEYCNNALRIEPKNAKAYLLRANAFMQMNSPITYPLAWRDAHLAITNKPDLSMAYTIRGTVYFQENDLNAAMADITKAIDLKKDNYEAKVIMVKLLDKLGNKEQANELYKNILKEAPNLNELKSLANRNAPL